MTMNPSEQCHLALEIEELKGELLRVREFLNEQFDASFVSTAVISWYASTCSRLTALTVGAKRFGRKTTRSRTCGAHGNHAACFKESTK